MNRTTSEFMAGVRVMTHLGEGFDLGLAVGIYSGLAANLVHPSVPSMPVK